MYYYIELYLKSTLILGPQAMGCLLKCLILRGIQTDSCVRSYTLIQGRQPTIHLNF